jgi:hypothetical protein
MTTSTRLLACVLGPAAIAALLTAPIAAQPPCALAWQPGDALAGLSGTANALVEWDSDGPGPLPVQVVAGGAFVVAGDRIVNRIALYDPATRRWAALGVGVERDVLSLLVRGNGRLVAGTDGGGVFEWDGTAWQRLGAVPNSNVRALVELPNGELVAGGSFTSIGGAPIHGLSRWDGAQWQPLGNPTLPWSLGSVNAMVRLPNGDLVVGGFFDQIGGVACNLVARWNGTVWSPLGAGSTLPVLDLVTAGNGELLARGGFGPGAGLGLARWNGTSWNQVPAGGPAGAVPLGPIGSDGVLFLGPTGLWVQQPSGWTSFLPWSSTGGVLRALPRANGEVFVAGSFLAFQGVPALRVARWNGSQWQSANDGSSGSVTAVAVAPDDSLFVGGSFRRIGGIAANGVARRQGTSWSALGFDANSVQQIGARPNGEVVFVGSFPIPSGGSHQLMRWQNGVATPIPLGAGLYPLALAPAADGTLWLSIFDVSLFRSRVFRWDGAALVPTALAVDGQLRQLVERPNGELILVGSFLVNLVPQTLLRWDGQTAQVIPGAPADVTSLALAEDGDVLCGVGVSPTQSVARWDGATWQALGTTFPGAITAIDSLPNGDVVLANRILNQPATSMLRWSGTQWSLLGTARGLVKVVWSPAGELLAFGDLVAVDNTPGALLARLSTTCAAGLVDRGGGCSGSAGAVQQRVDQRAWLGGTLRSATTGLPTNALPLGVLGLAPTAVPLITLNPLGGAGCVLRVTPDAVALLPTVGGEARGAWLLPNAPALLGLALESQTVVVETGSGGAVAALTASNAITLTIGSF